MKIRNFLTKALKLFAFEQVNADLSSNVNSFGEEWMIPSQKFHQIQE